jgi:hypothetical protein
MPSEIDILDALEKRQVQLPPLSFRVVTDVRSPPAADPKFQIDAIVEASWSERTWKFATELKRFSTPKLLRDALGAIRPAAAQAQLNPMIVVPYLSPENIASLETERVSGLDLCGNGIVVVPGQLLVVRTGNANRFPQSATIRNVYRGDSSLVARAFLARPEYTAVGEIQTAIRDLGGTITLPTVSKVLKALEGDLIVGREPGSIRLLQPDKLLERLAVNYRAPKTKDRYVGKIALGEQELPRALANAARQVGSRFVLTGAASATRYAVMAREPIVAAYCSSPPEELLSVLPAPAERSDRFPNIDLIWTTDAPVYFDPDLSNVADEAEVPCASPVQAYLELASGDNRQRQTAEQVREYLLRRVRRDGRNA